MVLLALTVFIVFSSCTKRENKIQYNFNSINDRCWIGEEFWSVPMEDWEVQDGRVECSSILQNATCTVLPWVLSESKGSFQVSVRMGLLEKGENDGSSGMNIGSIDPDEEDYRSAIYFGEGINVGVNTEGYAFLGQHFKELEEGFDFSEFTLELRGDRVEDAYQLVLKVLDREKIVQVELEMNREEKITGIIQLVNNFRTSKSKRGAPTFWFDDLFLDGEKLTYKPENSFGPVLWAMFTLSRQTLNITAQFPPISDQDNQVAELYIADKHGAWNKLASETIDGDARCAAFKVEDWDDSRDHLYKITYACADVHGKKVLAEYEGAIKRDPVDRPLNVGALTCQFWTGFPYAPIHDDLKAKNPDLLYFSGDQIYEGNGGYPIKNFPDSKAINSYLGKWYMFGWVFGDLMRNVPTICTPDDHDIFQGNLWGGGGVRKTEKNRFAHDRVGFDQAIGTVNAVNRTQCSHLPDPFDPATIENGMSVWYTDLVYGRVSFAIVSDRVFKSGPNEVATWDGRLEQIREPLEDPSILDKPGLEFLGERQEDFLREWVRDWKGADMKVLLSQTVFANSATHYGGFDNFWYGDMDSGGWPKKARDRAVGIIRKGFAFHITGDQHLPTLSQYGIEKYRDAGWCYCTPAISICYSRWFRPDDLRVPVSKRPEHGLPNTGEYEDVFGNYNYMYAVGNPGDFHKVLNRYEFENSKSAGFGFVIFDKDTRDITIESWKMLGGQFPGWPHTISQYDNYSREAVAWLPTIEVKGDPDPVVEVYRQESGELEYAVRMMGNTFIPKVFSKEKYRIRVGYPESGLWMEKTDIGIFDEADKEVLHLD